MKFFKILFILAFFFSFSNFSYGIDGIPATESDVVRLKKDLSSGNIQVRKTRLKDIVRNYGLPIEIKETDKKISYEYGDLKLDFIKEKFMKSWQYDSFKKPAYSDDIDDLRFDLESKELVGDYISIKKIRKDYGEPTEIYETDYDTGESVYYYGNIKLTFENVVTLESWVGKELNKLSDNY